MEFLKSSFTVPDAGTCGVASDDPPRLSPRLMHVRIGDGTLAAAATAAVRWVAPVTSPCPDGHGPTSFLHSLTQACAQGPCRSCRSAIEKTGNKVTKNHPASAFKHTDAES
jgi:hypothetical protein